MAGSRSGRTCRRSEAVVPMCGEARGFAAAGSAVYRLRQGSLCGVLRRAAFRQRDGRQEREMVGGVTILAAHGDDLRLPDLDRRRDEDVIEPEPEEESPITVERAGAAVIRVTNPEGVHQWVGVQHPSRGRGAQPDLPLQVLDGRAPFPGVEISGQDKGIGIGPRLDSE